MGCVVAAPLSWGAGGMVLKGAERRTAGDCHGYNGEVALRRDGVAAPLCWGEGGRVLKGAERRTAGDCHGYNGEFGGVGTLPIREILLDFREFLGTACEQ